MIGKTKSDAELFALASKKVFTELAALEGTTTTTDNVVQTPSETQKQKAEIERRRKEDYRRTDCQQD